MDLEIIEMRIKFIEALLKRYNEVSTRSGISLETQEETTNRFLDELNKLYKQRDLFKHRKQ